MDLIKILREQIEELNKLLDLKNKRIAELEIMLAAPRPIFQPFVSHPGEIIPPYKVTCSDSCKDGVVTVTTNNSPNSLGSTTLVDVEAAIKSGKATRT